MLALTPEGVKEMEIIPVESSYIEAIGYDESKGTLLVRFRDGSPPYLFVDVPRAIHVAFLAAESKGEYFNAEVRNRYRYRRDE